MRSKYYYISVCCLVILLCGTMLAGMQLSAVRDKKGFKAVVGSLYEKNPEIADQVLQSALNSDRAHSQEKAEMGEKAAEQLGYTDKVYDFYFFRLGKREEQVFWGIFCAGIGTLLIVICSKGYTSFLKQLDDLRRRIRKTTEQEEEFMMEVDGEKEWIRLEYEIRDIIKGWQKQERYLRRRQKQMELFIENVAHQIKTPLTGMILNLELLDSRLKEKQSVQQDLKEQSAQQALEEQSAQRALEEQSTQQALEEQSTQQALEEQSAQRVLKGQSEQKNSGTQPVRIAPERQRRDGIQLVRDSIKNGERIRGYIMQLLNLARMEAGKIHFRKESVELTELFEEIQEKFGKERLLLRWQAETDDERAFIIKGDRDWLYDAVFNLVENSICHGKPDTPVELQAIGLGNEVKIVLRDQGSGMGKEEMEHLFDRYYVGDTSEKFSTGIGLHLAWYVIQGHHGEIVAESLSGEGTSITFRLPRFDLKEKIAAEGKGSDYKFHPV